MSSPNHPTSEIEDAFSSNFPDFIPASLDYVLASPGKTYSSSSNLFGVVSIASPTLSLFHDDPYMTVLQAFYAKESLIPPPTIASPPQEFFLPEGLCHQEHNRSFLLYFALTQEFRWEKLTTSTSEAPSMTQSAIKKLLLTSGHCSSGSQLQQWQYCPRIEVRKMEDELYNLTVKGNDLKPYVRRFQELAVICPNMVPNTEKLLEAFIGGLPRSIEGNVTDSPSKLKT
ncbi:hypothetical protein Tco_0855686 [Tanacetum coccineum]